MIVVAVAAGVALLRLGLEAHQARLRIRWGRSIRSITCVKDIHQLCNNIQTSDSLNMNTIHSRLE